MQLILKILLSKMSNHKYAHSIFEEYCDKVENIGEDSVEIKVQGKYFTELYTCNATWMGLYFNNIR